MFAVERKTGQPTFGVICDAKVVAAAVTEGAGRPSAFDVTTAGLGETPRLLRTLGWAGNASARPHAVPAFCPAAICNPHLYLQALGVDPGGVALARAAKVKSRVRCVSNSEAIFSHLS